MFNTLRIGANAKSAKKFTPVHPDPAIGSGHGITLKLHGKHSEEYRNAIAAMLRRTKKGDQSLEESIGESARLIGACCEGYEGPEVGKFDRAALIETLKDDDYRWLRLQAEKFMQSDDNFF